MKSFFTPGKVCFENRFNCYVVVYFSFISGKIMLFLYLNNYAVFCISLKIGIFLSKKI